jgi:hypothetical protein
MGVLTLEQAIEAGYAADTREEAMAARDAIEELCKDIPPTEMPERAPEALGVLEMLDRLIEVLD